MDCDPIPLHHRYYERIPRPELYLGETDLELAWLHLNPGPHRLRGAFNMLSHVRPPRITMVGSSHVYHLSSIFNKEPLHYRELYHLGRHQIHKCGGLPRHHRDFLSNARFVSCGGLKWSNAIAELNGVFNSYDKWQKYGNQWANFDATTGETE